MSHIHVHVSDQSYEIERNLPDEPKYQSPSMLIKVLPSNKSDAPIKETTLPIPSDRDILSVTSIMKSPEPNKAERKRIQL